MSIEAVARAANLRALARDLLAKADEIDAEAKREAIAIHDGSEPQSHVAPFCADDEPPSRDP